MVGHADRSQLDTLLTATMAIAAAVASFSIRDPSYVMLASDIPLDRIITVIKKKHDRRCLPGNPLVSWSDLLKPVAEAHARAVLF